MKPESDSIIQISKRINIFKSGQTLVLIETHSLRFFFVALFGAFVCSLVAIENGANYWPPVSVLLIVGFFTLRNKTIYEFDFNTGILTCDTVFINKWKYNHYIVTNFHSYSIKVEKDENHDGDNAWSVIFFNEVNEYTMNTLVDQKPAEQIKITLETFLTEFAQQ
jgi:hypothetical protein